MTPSARPWRIRCLFRDQLAHIQPVEAALAGRAEFQYDADWDPAKITGDLVVCINEYHYDVIRCLDAARAAGIPTLTLQDGILEWRCQYDNPLFGAAPQHQPVLADKIACLGAQSARQIAAWGNAGKTEITGMPRLDQLLQRPRVPVRQPATRLLVMTAKNPGFTEAQREITITSLRDLKRYLDTRADLQVQWRVSKSVADSLGVANQLQEVATGELAAQVEQADAVISTLSTAMLEAMLLGRPVAALDYHNVPRFVPTAWTITAKEHIAPVVDEILRPPATKLTFQNDCLHDCLRLDGPAAPRVAALIEAMIARQPVNLPVPAKSAATIDPRLLRAENEIERLKAQLAERPVAKRLLTKLRRAAKK
ncbi:MAG: hypothetical protein PCFJNLEI_02218 [Verrucomicrobiae bacterium]|nr:hypothetical protein [Verrucomicrobiae bacterium]